MRPSPDSADVPATDVPAPGEAHRPARGERRGHGERRLGRHRHLAGTGLRRPSLDRQRRGRPLEQHVDEVVRRAVGVGREATCRGVAVAAVVGRGRRQVALRQRAAEEAGRHRVVTLGREVGDDVGRAGGHLERLRQRRRLPAGGRLVGERDGGEPGPGRRPDRAGVGAVVADALEEADRLDRAVARRGEGHAELQRRPVVGGGRVGHDVTEERLVLQRLGRPGAERPGPRAEDGTVGGGDARRG